MSDQAGMRPFQPLHDRLAGLPIDEKLHDDVPVWLDAPLHDWLHMVFVDLGQSGAETLARRVLVRLRWGKDSNRWYSNRLELAQQAELLTAIDAVLQLHPG